MNKAIKFLLVLGAFSVMSSPAFALNEIMKNYRGIRSLGMGGLVTTTGRHDEALFGNPATQMETESSVLQILNLTAEVNDNFLEDYGDVSDATSAEGTGVISTIADKNIDGRNEHSRLTLIVPGYYNPKLFGENTGFSFGLLLNFQSNLMLRSNAVVDSQTMLDAGPAFGFGHKFFDGALDVGINLRVLYRLAADKSLKATAFLGGQKISISDIGGQGIGVDGDIGAYYKLPVNISFLKGLSVGGSINNLITSDYRTAGKELIKKVKGTPPKNERGFNVGVRADIPDLAILSDNLFALELQDMGPMTKKSSFYKLVHFGLETHLINLLFVRAGVNQGYLGAGLGVDLPIVKIDLATYGEEIGTNAGQLEDRRFALRLAFEI